MQHRSGKNATPTLLTSWPLRVWPYKSDKHTPRQNSTPHKAQQSTWARCYSKSGRSSPWICQLYAKLRRQALKVDPGAVGLRLPQQRIKYAPKLM